LEEAAAKTLGSDTAVLLIFVYAMANDTRRHPGKRFSVYPGSLRISGDGISKDPG
jgi:hypothetical protein